MITDIVRINWEDRRDDKFILKLIDNANQLGLAGHRITKIVSVDTAPIGDTAVRFICEKRRNWRRRLLGK